MSFAHRLGAGFRRLIKGPPLPRIIILMSEVLEVDYHTVIGRRGQKTVASVCTSAADAQRERVLMKAQGYRRLRIVTGNHPS